MRAPVRKALAVLLCSVPLALVVGPVGAHDPAAVLPPADVMGECGVGPGARAIVVASDRAAQSDMYNAVSLLQVMRPLGPGGACLVLAGSRDGAFPSDQRERLRGIEGLVIVLGGEAAVPNSKLEGIEHARLSGDDRWHTAELVGQLATYFGVEFLD